MNKILEFINIIYNKTNFFTASLIFGVLFWFTSAMTDTYIFEKLNIDSVQYHADFAAKYSDFNIIMWFYVMWAILSLVCFVIWIVKYIIKKQREK